MSRVHFAEARRRNSCRPDQGDTLIEVLIAVVIMGILVVAIITGYLSAAQNQRQHRFLAQSETLTRSYVENLQLHAGDYASCAATYSPAAGDSGLTAQVASTAYWVQGSDSPAQFSATCGAGGGIARVQKLTVTVTHGSELIMDTDVVLRTSP
jgi:type II secretory pathway pseudopilin PulG